MRLAFSLSFFTLEFYDVSNRVLLSDTSILMAFTFCLWSLSSGIWFSFHPDTIAMGLPSHEQMERVQWNYLLCLLS